MVFAAVLLAMNNATVFVIVEVLVSVVTGAIVFATQSL